MQEMMTIKEVYSQCRENDWLGTERARVSFNGGDIATILGFNNSGFSRGVIVQYERSSSIGAEDQQVKVEWIGNKPSLESNENTTGSEITINDLVEEIRLLKHAVVALSRGGTKPTEATLKTFFDTKRGI